MDDKPVPDFSMDDLYVELESMLGCLPEGEGWRVEELVGKLRRGPTTIYRMLNKLDAEGRLETAERRILCLGRRREMPVTVYRLKVADNDINWEGTAT